MANITQDVLLRPADAAAVLRVSRATIYRLIATGQIDTVHVGARRATRISRAALDSYIRQNTATRSA